MSKFKQLKQKVKDNKGKIIAGIIFIGGAYIIVKQCGDIKQLKINDSLKDEQIATLIANDTAKQEIINKQQGDINILKSVMNGTVLSNLRESAKRQLRYAEGRLNNALKNDNVISEVDERLRREEIDFFSKQIEKIDKAESMISK